MARLSRNRTQPTFGTATSAQRRLSRRTRPACPPTIRKPSPAGLAPGRPPVGAAVEIAPGLVEIAPGLLLDGLAAGGQPLVLRPGLGQLPTLRGEVRGGLAAGGAVGVGLLQRQVPDEPGLRAVPEQRRLLRRRRVQAEPGHPPSLSAGSDNPADRAFLPALNGGASSPGYR